MVQDAAEMLERQGVEQLYRVVRRPNPGANTQLDIIVPGGVIWLVQSLTVVLVTDATVINRNVALTIDDGTDVFCGVHSDQVQQASTTRRHSWIRQQGISVLTLAPFAMQNCFPDMPLLSGFHIRTVTTDMQAGDDFGAPVLYVREYQERGLAAEIAYELAQLIREDIQLTSLESGGF